MIEDTVFLGKKSSVAQEEIFYLCSLWNKHMKKI